jgi:chemotaxis protein methyltransferase CheR
MTAITADEISTLTKYVYSLCGVALDSSKAYLLEARFRPLLSKYGLRSYMELYQRAVADRSGEMEKEIVSAITTNETLFFRDNSPFEVFKHKIIPDIVDARSKTYPGRAIPIRIWSAACSTGQEVYSIAICLLEVLGRIDRYDITILGTDISDEAIAKASYGKYTKFEIERGLPPSILQRYFNPTGDAWRIKDEIRSMAVFKKFNLMKSFTGLGRFDVVFCRNVAIYFTPQDKRAVFEKIATVLEPDGALIIGSTESLSGVTPVFEPRRYLRAVYYQLADAAPRPIAAMHQGPPPQPMPTAPPRPASSLPQPKAPLAPPRQPGLGGTSAPNQSPAASLVPQRITPPTAPGSDTPPQGAAQPTSVIVPPSDGGGREDQPPVAVAPRRPVPPPRPRMTPAAPPSDKVALKKLLMQKKAALAQRAS